MTDSVMDGLKEMLFGRTGPRGAQHDGLVQTMAKSTVRTVGTSDYKELFDVNGAGFEWIGETDTRNQTNTPDLAEVAPTFGMASAKPQASEESLDDLADGLRGYDRSPEAEPSQHLWRGALPTGLDAGEHRIEVRAFDRWRGEVRASTRYRLADAEP